MAAATVVVWLLVATMIAPVPGSVHLTPSGSVHSVHADRASCLRAIQPAYRTSRMCVAMTVQIRGGR